MKTLDEALATPGIYVVHNPEFIFFVEVDQELVCHQLSLTEPGYPRDGVLPPDGWIQRPSFEGPFARKEPAK